MIITLQILGVIALLSFIFFTFIIVSTLSQIKVTLENADKKLDVLGIGFTEIKVKAIVTLDGVNELKDKIILAIDGLNVTNQKAIESLNDFNTMSQQITDSIDSLQKIGSKIVDLVEPVESAIEGLIYKVLPSITATSRLFGAMSKGFGVFKNRIGK